MRRVSILIPTFNEEGIATTLDALAAHLSTIPATAFEVLLIDDSKDAHKATIRQWIAQHEASFPSVRVALLDGERRGKGHAVKVGARASTGDIVFTIDADLPVPLHHIEEFVQALDETHADAVIGERSLMRNVFNPARFVLSRALLFFQRVVVFQSSRFRDTQCGFKAYRGDVLRSLAERQTVEGGMFDIELLFIAVQDRAKIEGRRVVQNPETRPSKIKVWRCIYTDPRDLVRVRVRGLVGGYKRPAAEEAHRDEAPKTPRRTNANAPE